MTAAETYDGNEVNGGGYRRISKRNMPSQTVQHVLDAARQLTPRQRERVIDELQRMASREEAIKAARRLRRKYRLPPAERKRLSDLLQRNAEGLLTADEHRELETFVDEYEQRSLAMAEELVRTVSPAAQNDERAES